MEKLALRSSYWIVNSHGNIVFGKGRMEILESIAQTGSINQTAKNLKMSYKTVWSKIKSTERHLNAKVVHADRQAGTHLTKVGWQLIEKFKQLHDVCMASDDRAFDQIFSKPLS